MNIWMDIVGATVISGIVLLILITLNSNVSSSSMELVSNNISQRVAADAGKNIENDFYKIGYRVSGEKILLADSTEIIYFTDIDNDGVIDSIRYYAGTTDDLTSTPNPYDFPVYRIQNNSQNPELTNIITKFKFSYFDSLGNEISYNTLTGSSARENIRIIQVYLKHSSAEPIDGEYSSVEWKKSIRPRNLN